MYKNQTGDVPQTQDQGCIKHGGIGPCSTFYLFCFVKTVLKHGVLLLGGGGGGYLPRYSATGVPSEYMVYVYATCNLQLAYELA